MTGYNTEQKKMLTKLLQQNKESSYTIEELAEQLKNIYGEKAPGKSTVYRLIPHLVDEGRVRRLPKSVGRGFLYQAVEAERCHGHLHMRCVTCGKFFHLDDSLSDELLLKVQELCGFSVSEKETVLFGSCLSCR